MAALHYITQGGYYPELILIGDPNEDNCDGLVINAPGQIVVIGYLAPRFCRVPLIVQRVGKLIVTHYEPGSFWGDTANLRCGNLYFDHYTPLNILPQRRSYDEYHHDLIFQSQAVLDDGYTNDPAGVIEHIHINNLMMESDLEQCNGIMLSEQCVYRHFHIGSQSLNIQIEAPYWLNANTLSDSIIGGGVSEIGSLSGRFEPSILLTKRKECDAVTERCVALGVPHADTGAYPRDGMIVI